MENELQDGSRKNFGIVALLSILTTSKTRRNENTKNFFLGLEKIVNIGWKKYKKQ